MTYLLFESEVVGLSEQRGGEEGGAGQGQGGEEGASLKGVVGVNVIRPLLTFSLQHSCGNKPEININILITL